MLHYGPGRALTRDVGAAVRTLFAASLTKSLVPETGGGSLTPTFSRSTIATEFGYAAGALPGDPMTLLDCDIGEARFRGARRISSGVWADTFADGALISAATLWGFRKEAARTNSIANNTMQGAVPGSPGTLPTGWTSSLGLTQTVVGTGTENGVEYIDIRLNGLTAATGTSISFNTGTGVTAAQNEVWSLSCFVKLVAGDYTNVSGVRLRLRQNDGAGVSLGFISATVDALPPTSGNLIDTRIGGSNTLSAVGTASVNGQILISHTTGGFPVDLTLRIGLPQLELGTVPTTPIKTSTVAVTRALDALTYASAGNADETRGSMVAEAVSEWVASSATGLNRGAVNIGRAFSSAQDIIIGHSNGALKAGFAAINQTTNQYNVATTLNLAANTPVKVALAWETDNCRAAFNGTLAALDTLASMPVSLTTLYIGDFDSGGAELNGCIKNTVIYATRLPDEMVRQLTL